MLEEEMEQMDQDAKDEKYRKIFYLALALLNISVLIVLLSLVHRDRDYSANQKENSYLIGASYMTMNNEFYKIISEEISARVEAEGDKLMLRDPALDADRQNGQIREMLAMGVDALIITPVEWESLAAVLERAKQLGVLIVVVDTNVYSDDLADCTITSDNYNAGYMVGKYFAGQNESARLVIMTHEATKSGQDRVRGFLDAVKDKKAIRVVEKIECMGQLEIAMPRLQEIMDDGVAFDNIFCLNDLAGVGAAAALDENGMSGKVGVYGVDASPDSKALIKEGMMTASAAQFPSEIGKRAADATYRLLHGQRVQKNILVPVELVTQENVEEYGIDRWQ